MRDKLPASILKRKKAGLDIPAHEWFRGPLLPIFEDTVNAQAVRDTGLFDYAAIQQLLSDHKNRRINIWLSVVGIAHTVSVAEEVEHPGGSGCQLFAR